MSVETAFKEAFGRDWDDKSMLHCRQGFLAGLEAAAKVCKQGVEEDEQAWWCYEQIIKLKE